MADRENISGDFLDKAMTTVKDELKNKRIPRAQKAILESLEAVLIYMRDDHQKVDELWRTHEDNKKHSNKWEPRLWEVAKIITGTIIGYIIGTN